MRVHPPAAPDAACPLCGSGEAREVFGALRPRTVAPTGRPTESLYGRAGRLVRCEGCGLVRQEPPVEAPYEDAADIEYLSEEEGIRQTFRGILARIETLRPHRGRILDVGCGAGLLLEEARVRGWDPVGVEPSGWAVEEAKERGLDVRQGSLEMIAFPSGSFGAVVASDVIEHVPHPLAFAEELHRVLAPEGVLLITTPNVESLAARVLRRWWWSVLPGHLFYFSPATLRRLLQTAGFTVNAITTHPKTFSLTYYAGRFTGYSGRLGRAAMTLVRFFGDADRLVAPDLRDRMAVVATRRSDDANDG